MKKKTSTKANATLVKAAPLPLENSFAEVLYLIQSARQRAYQAVNSELVTLCWRIGEYISRKIEADGWGKGTVIELSAYIQRQQPGIRGFSSQNIWRMRQFFDVYR
jgi:hypothetical protein